MKNLCVAILLAILPLTFAATNANAAPIEAWEDFQAKYGHHLSIVWNERTGMPKWINGVIEPIELMSNLGLLQIQSRSSAEDLSRAFVEAHSDLLGFDLSDIRLLKTTRRKCEVGRGESMERDNGLRGLKRR